MTVLHSEVFINRCNPSVLPSTNPEYDVQTNPDSGKARLDRGTTQLFGHFLYLSVMFPDVFGLPPLFCGTHLDTEASADYAAKRWQNRGKSVCDQSSAP